MTGTAMARRTAPHPTATHTCTKVVADWTALIPGDFVTVLESYTVPHSGWIDAVTEDGTIIWLVLAFGRGRRMFFRRDGDVITVEVPEAAAGEHETSAQI
jgi:hypothetical protein